MDISSAANTSQVDFANNSSKETTKEEVATSFEKIFARKLVKELTKDSFDMGDNNGVMGQSNNLYRSHITDTLANELAKQGKLGMADLITEYSK